MRTVPPDTSLFSHAVADLVSAREPTPDLIANLHKAANDLHGAPLEWTKDVRGFAVASSAYLSQIGRNDDARIIDAAIAVVGTAAEPFEDTLAREFAASALADALADTIPIDPRDYSNDDVVVTSTQTPAPAPMQSRVEPTIIADNGASFTVPANVGIGPDAIERAFVSIGWKPGTGAGVTFEAVHGQLAWHPETRGMSIVGPKRITYAKGADGGLVLVGVS